MPSRKSFRFLGFCTGLISGCIGGGSSLLVVPYLKHRHLTMKDAVAVSTACNIILAIVGFSGSILAGMKVDSLPDYSIGYIYLPVLAILLAGTYIGVPIGGKLVNYLKESTLSYGYLALLITIFIIVTVNTLTLIH
jgi:uncharacterized protein